VGGGRGEGEKEVEVEAEVEVGRKRRRVEGSPVVRIGGVVPGRTMDGVHIYGTHSRVVVSGRDRSVSTMNSTSTHNNRSGRKPLDAHEEDDDDDDDKGEQGAVGRVEPVKPQPASKPRFEPNEKYENWTVKHTCGCGRHFGSAGELNFHRHDL
jgi:hypothetical protein